MSSRFPRLVHALVAPSLALAFALTAGAQERSVPSRDQRWQAAWELGRGGPETPVTPAEVDELLALLDDVDPALRFVAADALARIGDAALDPGRRAGVAARLVALAADPDADVRWAVARALEHHGRADRARYDALCRLAHGDAPAVRRAALAALGATRGAEVPRARAELAGWIDADDAASAAGAMLALGRLGPLADATARRLAAAAETGSSIRREAAVRALARGTFGDEPTTLALARRLDEATGERRRQAARALGGAVRGEAFCALARALERAEPDLVPTILDALSALIERPAVQRSLSADDRRRARAALANVAAWDPDACRRLARALERPPAGSAVAATPPEAASGGEPASAEPRTDRARTLELAPPPAVSQLPPPLPRPAVRSATARIAERPEPAPAAASPIGAAEADEASGATAARAASDPPAVDIALPTSAPAAPEPAASEAAPALPSASGTSSAPSDGPDEPAPTAVARGSGALRLAGLVLLFLVLLATGLVLATYLVRPADTWRLARALDDWTVRRFGPGALRVSPTRWLGVEALAGRPRAVDAWIEERAPRARIALTSRPAARARSVRVPTPIVVGGRLIERPSVADLRAALGGSPEGLRLFGEGGSGKTTLAYRLALAALGDDQDERVAPSRLLPVVFEGADALPREATPAAWLRRVRAELEGALAETLTAAEVRRLVLSRRLLVLLDGLSELDPESRRIATGIQAACPRIVVLGTARAPGDFGPLFGVQVALVRIDGSDLARFLDRYLVASGVRHTIDDSTFFDGLGRLTRLADEAEVTPLVASLFVDAWLASRDGDDPLPRTLGELLDARLARALRMRGRRRESETLADATAVAVRVLGSGLRPGVALGDEVRALLGARDPADVDARIDELLAVGVLEPAGRAGLRFVLDPLAEHLAARATVQELSSLQDWSRVLHATRLLPDAPQAVAGWLRALRDEARLLAERGDGAARSALPDLDEHLRQARVGTTRELSRSRALPRPERGAIVPPAPPLGPRSTIAELVRALAAPDPVRRARAAELCGARGPEAAPAVAALAAIVGQGSATGVGALARASAAAALGRLGPSARAALPELRRASVDQNELVRVEARRALRRLEPSVEDELVRAAADRDDPDRTVGLDEPGGLGQVDGRTDVAGHEP